VKAAKYAVEAAGKEPTGDKQATKRHGELTKQGEKGLPEAGGPNHLQWLQEKDVSKEAETGSHPRKLQRASLAKKRQTGIQKKRKVI